MNTRINSSCIAEVLPMPHVTRCTVSLLTRVTAGLFALFAGLPAYSQTTTAPLLQSTNMTYLGAFRLPNTDPLGSSTFNYGGRGISVYKNPSTGKTTLFMQGHAQRDGEVAQIEVPATLVKSNTWDNLPMGTVLQNFSDVTDNRLGSAGDTYNGMPVYGTLAYNNRLIVAVGQAYGSNQVASHGVSGLTLSTSNDFKGFYPFTGAEAGPRALGGPMTLIPAEWQAAFGGPALTGQCCLSVIGATSSGPSATVFNPDTVGVGASIPGKTVLFYPLSNPVCGAFNCEATQNNIFNLVTRVVGMAFPRGSRTVLFIGGHGTGRYCYGTAIECNDPTLPDNKGPHAQPYRHQVWAYDANDLVAVKNGQKQSYQPRPYAIWTLPELTMTGVNVAGAGFDSETGRLYVTQDYQTQPRVDVYQIDVTNVIVPRAPSNLSILP